jgi:lauroyl/myristoyl acyltransferase
MLTTNPEEQKQKLMEASQRLQEADQKVKAAYANLGQVITQKQEEKQRKAHKAIVRAVVIFILIIIALIWLNSQKREKPYEDPRMKEIREHNKKMKEVQRDR